MAETFIAIGSAITSTIGSAGTAISSFFTGGSAAASTGAAAATTTTASTFSKVLTVGSALSSIAGGFSMAEAKKDQARQVGVQMAQERARDSQRRATIAEEYADMVADQKAVQIANGLNPNVGTPASVRGATRDIAERNLSISRENTRSRMAVARLRQRSLYRGANTAMLGGFTQAAGTYADGMQAWG
jgi:hypothetical protein